MCTHVDQLLDCCTTVHPPSRGHRLLPPQGTHAGGSLAQAATAVCARRLLLHLMYVEGVIASLGASEARNQAVDSSCQRLRREDRVCPAAACQPCQPCLPAKQQVCMEGSGLMCGHARQFPASWQGGQQAGSHCMLGA